MTDLFSKVRELFLKEQGEGTFSHFSFSCGFLKEKESLFLWEGSSSEEFFDLASLTKALVTAPLVLRAVNMEKMDEKTSVFDWLDKEAACFDETLQKIKVLDLLSHTSGLPAWYNFYAECEGGGRTLLQKLNDSAKRVKPSQGFFYSDVGYILLGLCLELKYKKNLDILFKEYSKTIGFKEEFLFFPKKSGFKGVVPTSFCPLRGRVLVGEVHDENSAFLGGVSGHAGLFGSRKGVLSFLSAFWKSKEAKKMLSLSLEKKFFAASFGWRTRLFNREESVGHLGFTGCALWVFPENSSYLLLLTNRVSSGRLSSSFPRFREKVLLLGKAILDDRK